MQELLPIIVKGHLHIEDDLGNVLVDKDNAIHPQNMARVISRALANESNYFIKEIAFGNGGTDISEDLLNYTAEGTKNLIYKAVELNKWGPTFQFGGKVTKEKSKVGKFLDKVNDAIDSFGGAGTAPTTIKYTDNITTQTIQKIFTNLIIRKCPSRI